MRLFVYTSQFFIQSKKRFERDCNMYIDEIPSITNTAGIGLPYQSEHSCFFQAS